MENKELQTFCEFYNVSLLNNSRRGIRRQNLRFFSDPTNANVVTDSRDYFYREYQDIKNTTVEYETEPVYVVEIPQSALESLAHLHHRFHNRSPGSGHPEMARTIIEKEWAENRLRAQYPAVQAAWEQYSLMLHLASNGKDLP